MLGVDHTDVNACGDWCVEFGKFWTDSVPTFFTETIPQAFQTAWDAVADWIETCVKPFFESCREWFSDNAEWLWPVAVGFVALGALVVGIVLPLVLCQHNPNLPPQNEEEVEPSFTPPSPIPSNGTNLQIPQHSTLPRRSAADVIAEEKRIGEHLIRRRSAVVENKGRQDDQSSLRVALQPPISRGNQSTLDNSSLLIGPLSITPSPLSLHQSTVENKGRQDDQSSTRVALQPPISKGHQSILDDSSLLVGTLSIAPLPLSLNQSTSGFAERPFSTQEPSKTEERKMPPPLALPTTRVVGNGAASSEESDLFDLEAGEPGKRLLPPPGLSLQPVESRFPFYPGRNASNHHVSTNVPSFSFPSTGGNQSLYQRMVTTSQMSEVDLDLLDGIISSQREESKRISPSVTSPLVSLLLTPGSHDGRMPTVTFGAYQGDETSRKILDISLVLTKPTRELSPPALLTEEEVQQFIQNGGTVAKQTAYRSDQEDPYSTDGFEEAEDDEHRTSRSQAVQFPVKTQVDANDYDSEGFEEEDSLDPKVPQQPPAYRSSYYDSSSDDDQGTLSKSQFGVTRTGHVQKLPEAKRKALLDTSDDEPPADLKEISSDDDSVASLDAKRKATRAPSHRNLLDVPLTTNLSSRNIQKHTTLHTRAESKRGAFAFNDRSKSPSEISEELETAPVIREQDDSVQQYSQHVEEHRQASPKALQKIHEMEKLLAKINGAEAPHKTSYGIERVFQITRMLNNALELKAVILQRKIQEIENEEIQPQNIEALEQKWIDCNQRLLLAQQLREETAGERLFAEKKLEEALFHLNERAEEKRALLEEMDQQIAYFRQELEKLTVHSAENDEALEVLAPLSAEKTMPTIDTLPAYSEAYLALKKNHVVVNEIIEKKLQKALQLLNGSKDQKFSTAYYQNLLETAEEGSNVTRITDLHQKTITAQHLLTAAFEVKANIEDLEEKLEAELIELTRQKELHSQELQEIQERSRALKTQGVDPDLVEALVKFDAGEDVEGSIAYWHAVVNEAYESYITAANTNADLLIHKQTYQEWLEAIEALKTA